MLRGSTAIAGLLCRRAIVGCGAILQQVAERDQRIALRAQVRDQAGRPRRAAPPPRARRRRRAGRRWRPARAARDARARACIAGAAGAGSRAAPSRTRTGCRAGGARGNSARLVMPHGGRKKRGGAPAACGDGVVPVADLARGALGPAAARGSRWLQVWLPRSWPACGDAARHPGAFARPLADQEEGRRGRPRAPGCRAPAGSCSGSGPSSKVSATARRSPAARATRSRASAGASPTCRRPRGPAPRPPSARPPASRRGPLGHEQGEPAALHDLAALVQDACAPR